MPTAMVKKVVESSSKEDTGEREIRRSGRLQAKRVAKQSVIQTEEANTDEDENDARPEEVAFSRGGEQARDERRRMFDASVRTFKELRAKRQRFAERNRLQKERKRLKAMERLPEEILEAIAEKTKEQTASDDAESSDEEEAITPGDSTQVKIDHGPFDVVAVSDVVNKPKRVNQTAFDFRQEHLYGDRLKRVDSLTFQSQKLKRHGPAVNFRQRLA